MCFAEKEQESAEIEKVIRTKTEQGKKKNKRNLNFDRGK